MNFRKREKIVMIIAFALVFIIAGAWTWDILTRSDGGSGTIGEPVELVLEKEVATDGILIPPLSWFAGSEGYAIQHEYVYTLTSEQVDAFDLGVNFNLVIGGLDTDEVYTALNPYLEFDGSTYDLEQGINDLDIEIGGADEVKLVIELNEDLKGSGIGIGRIANETYEYEIEFYIERDTQ